MERQFKKINITHADKTQRDLAQESLKFRFA